MSRNNAWLALPLSLLLFLPATTVRGASERSAPPKTYAKVLFAALNYVKPPKSWKKGFRILVVHDGSRSSRTRATDVYNALRSRGKASRVARKIKVKGVDISAYRGDGLRTQLKEGEYTCLFLSSGLSGSIKEIIKACKGLNVLTLTDRSREVKAGIAFGLPVVKSRPKIHINAGALRAAKVKFKAAILKRAKIVDRKRK